jgi:pyruvate dehydrogenase E1 component alpha subunit
MSLPSSKGISSRSIAERAASYNIPTFVADGNDPVSVYRAVKEAGEICRSGDGPCFVECRTYRLKGHGIYDKAEYRPSGEAREWSSKDPIRLFETMLVSGGTVSKEQVEKMRAEIEPKLEEAVKKARTSPTPAFDSLYDLVYPGEWNP